MMTVTRLEDGTISVSGADQIVDFSLELLDAIGAGHAYHVTYDGETVLINAIEGAIRYRRVGEPDEHNLCRMERVA